MGRIVNFEDLQVWQKSHKLVLKVYEITKGFPEVEKYGLSSQMRRAAISIPANIAEGFKKRGKRDKINFYNISQGSLNELKYYMILANDLGYIEEPKYGLYLNGRKVMYLQNTVIIGCFDLYAQIIDADVGIIKVDGKEIYKGKGDIFLNLNLPAGLHKISAIAKNEKEEAGNKISIIVLA